MLTNAEWEVVNAIVDLHVSGVLRFSIVDWVENDLKKHIGTYYAEDVPGQPYSALCAYCHEYLGLDGYTFGQPCLFYHAKCLYEILSNIEAKTHLILFT